MKILKKEWLQILILAVPFCAVALLWDKLPAQMPMQWDGNSHPVYYGPKVLAALLLPCANLALAVLLMVFPRIDPRFSGYDEETKASLWRTFSIVRRTFTLFLSIVAVSDIHLGTEVGIAQLGRIMTLIKASDPDMVLLAGDIFDMDVSDEMERKIRVVVRSGGVGALCLPARIRCVGDGLDGEGGA